MSHVAQGPRPLSVSGLIQQVKSLLEGEFPSVYVEGEVSNLTSSATGHWYFNISDTESSVAVCLFKNSALKNTLIRQLKNGDKIICCGSVNVYSKRGTFQIVAQRILDRGKGELLIQYEYLKKRLSSEGLFDLDRKKKIPEFPRKIAIITALNAAALQDFLNIFLRRCIWANIIIIPSLVQGEKAPAQLIQALQNAQRISDLDVVVLTRGGGSFEDLWCFNDEKLAREIFNSKIPVITAIGHQVDFTICDFVADLRAETPSAAAELLSSSQFELQERLQFVGRNMLTQLKLIFLSSTSRLSQLSPQMLLERLWRKYYMISEKLNLFFNSLKRINELTKVVDHNFELEDLINRLNLQVLERFRKYEVQLDSFQLILNALNPHSVLGRGYCIIYHGDKQKEIVANANKFSKLKENDHITIEFSDGEGYAKKVN